MFTDVTFCDDGGDDVAGDDNDAALGSDVGELFLRRDDECG